MPAGWGGHVNSNKRHTKTDMLANRRAEFIPHISYDLDGDGVVGNRDYVIAKLYD